MKRIFNLILGAAALFAVSACQDVPAPYGLNTDGASGSSLPYSSTSLSTGWKTMAVNNLGNPWSQGSSYTQATGYQAWEGSTKSNKECEGVLLSPSLNTKTDSTKVKMTFEYCVGYASNDPEFANHIKIYASNTYTTGDFVASDWTPIAWTATHTSTDWTLEETQIQLPSEFVNQENVHIAFWFYSPATKSATFEVKTFKLLEGAIGGGVDPEPGPEPTPSGDNLLVNGDFETWTSGQPDNWKSASTASSATLTQSTTAHAGSYAVAVQGAEANKRLAYKELKLKKGTYAFSFYARASKTDLAQCRPGYVPVTDGAVGSYAYGDYVNIKASDWTLVSHSFTLDAPTTVCLVVMNPKGGTSYQDTQDLLIDDASLTTSDGGIEGGDDPQPTPSEEAKGSGTLADPYNPLAANNYIATLGADVESANDIYVKGKIASIKEAPNAQYGNATFYISETGTTTGTQFYAFRVLYLGNQKFTGTETLNVGDEVIICGKVVNYKGNTPETASNKAYIYSHNGKQEGGGDDPDPEPGPTPSGDNLLVNGDFESWTGEQPDNWKSTSTAGNATLKQSTDAHAGSYSVAVVGTTANKRIAYKETKLAAGTYTLTFYAKGTTSDKCQCRPGYVPVNDDGSVGSYVYGDYATLNMGSWTQVTHNFTLDAETTICIVVMNPKGGTAYQDTQDLLIDDASLIKN